MKLGGTVAPALLSHVPLYDHYTHQNLEILPDGAHARKPLAGCRVVARTRQRCALSDFERLLPTRGVVGLAGSSAESIRPGVIGISRKYAYRGSTVSPTAIRKRQPVFKGKLAARTHRYTVGVRCALQRRPHGSAASMERILDAGLQGIRRKSQGSPRVCGKGCRCV